MRTGRLCSWSLSRQGNAAVTRIVCENVPMQENVSLPVTSLFQESPHLCDHVS